MTRDRNFDFDPEMNSASNQGGGNRACEKWEPFIILLAGGEDLPTDLHSEWIQHAAECEACSGALAREREMLSLLSEYRSEPDGTLLASCRAGLDDAIDREEEHGWLRRSFGLVFPASWLVSANWLASASTWGAAALLLAGFSTGLLLGPRVLHRTVSISAAVPQPVAAANTVASDPSTPAKTTDLNPSTSLAALDRQTADVAAINVLPASDGGAPQVQLQLREQQPFTLQGTVDNDDVKDVLLNILKSGDRFCPDVRLDAIEALRSRTNDPDVRSALCHAVHKDHNAAVRLKALEALNNAEPQDIIQQTLLDALLDDQNEGVRVEAMNSLSDMVSKGQLSSSDRMLSVLQDRMHNDPSAYIRMQSAEAIRDLGPRGKF
jgi:hypothetical protein